MNSWCYEQARSVLARERRNLYNLSLVCKKFRLQAQPILHHVYGFVDEGDEALPRFCRTISTVLHLSRSVQVLNLKMLITASWSSSKEVQWVRPVVERFTSRLDFPAIPSRPQQDNGFLLSVLPVLVLLQVTQLKHLYTSGRSRWSMFTHVRRRPDESTQQLLPELRFLEIKTPNPLNYSVRPTLLGSASRALLVDFLKDFSRLESLSLRHVLNSSVPKNLSLKSVRRLDLQHTTLDKDQLFIFIGATGNLKEFKYSELQGMGYPGMSDLADASGRQPVTSSEVVSALMDKKATLRKLMLKTYYREGQGLGHLSELHNLESLELNIRTFCDPVERVQNGTIDNVDRTGLFEFLPASLKSLAIDVGPKGLGRMRLCLLRFCGATKHQPLRPSALALKRIRLLLTGQEFLHEDDGGLDNEGFEPGSEYRRVIDSLHGLCTAWVQDGQRVFEISTEPGEEFEPDE